MDNQSLGPGANGGHELPYQLQQEMPRVRKTRKGDCTGPRADWLPRPLSGAPPSRAATARRSNTFPAGRTLGNCSPARRPQPPFPHPLLADTSGAPPSEAGACVTGPPGKPRPPSEMTGPAPLTARDTDARHPGWKIGESRRAAPEPVRRVWVIRCQTDSQNPLLSLRSWHSLSRLGELNSGSEESAPKSWLFLRLIPEELGELILGAGAAAKSLLPAAHAPLTPGCGRITQPEASIMHGLTCSRDPPACRRRRVPSGPRTRLDVFGS